MSMTLAPGTRLGPYDVVSPLGTGGMGEVYRARDRRLGRDVAIKVVSGRLVDDPDALARFQREARVVASLSHPNIVALHDVGTEGHVAFAVMELLDGESLDRSVGPSGLPWTRALEIAASIADGLASAHDHGIVHRDLKPANVLVTRDGRVKVLDFGLATQVSLRGRDVDDVAALTETKPGVVLGTVGYMSPEQVRSESADARSDIFSLGCVLYELLSGRRPFGRSTAPEEQAAILRDQPGPIAVVNVPPEVNAIVQRCLEKQPDQRFQSARDLAFALRQARGSSGTRAARRPIAIAAAVILAVVGAVLAMVRFIPPSKAAVSSWDLNLAPPEGHSFLATAVETAPVPSPDGTRVAFVATAANEPPALWVRGLKDGSTERRLSGTENAATPFWSPDGRSIGFSADGWLKRIDADTGTIQAICKCVRQLLGATWSSNGVIVFAPFNRSALYRVPEVGGTPQPITALDSGRKENSHRWPQFLPDGRHLLYTARSDVTKNTGVHLTEIGSGERQWLVEAQSQAMYAASGHLLFVRAGTLLADAFDPTTGRLSGEPVAVAGPVGHYPSNAHASFAISADGAVLTYYRGESQQVRQLVQFDRRGMRLRTIGEERMWGDLALSPDGAWAALVASDEASGNRDIWLMEIATGRSKRWSSHPANDWRPVWSPNSRELAFASDRDGQSAVYRGSIDSDDVRRVVPARGPEEGFFPQDWSDDDQILMNKDTAERTTLWTVSASGGQPRFLKQTGGGQISPDGRWLAYASNESGRNDIYVSSRDGTRKHIVSAGGRLPRWSDDGPLMYLGPGEYLMSVTVEPGTFFKAAPPERVFASCFTSPWDGFDPGPDGTTFWLCPGSRGTSGVVDVKTGWSSALGRKK